MRILQFYGLEPSEILGVQKGYRNESHPVKLRDGTIRNLVLYKTEPGIVQSIRRIHAISRFLVSSGLPIRCPVDERIVCLKSDRFEKYGALYTYLPGMTISWDAYTQKHIKLLGKTMSDMHVAMRPFDSTMLPDAVDQYLALLERVRAYFATQSVSNAVEDKLHLQVDPHAFPAARMVLHACRLLPDKQALHMDFVRGNILFDDSSGEVNVSGILDFEKVACGHPLFDISRTLAFLLVDCKYKSDVKIRKYFLHSGYNKYGMTPFRDVSVVTRTDHFSVLEGLLSMFLLYDFYKFLRHNPYESLLQNEHFIRTRDLLIERGCILDGHLL